MASVSKRKDGRPGYQVRYRDPAGVQRARQFVRKLSGIRHPTAANGPGSAVRGPLQIAQRLELPDRIGRGLPGDPGPVVETWHSHG